MDTDIPEGRKCEVHVSRDMRKIVTLMALGFTPVKGGIYASHGVLYYEFRRDEIEDALHDYEFNKDMHVEVHDFWRAWDSFRAAMRKHLSPKAP